MQKSIRDIPREDMPEIIGRLVGMLVSAVMYQPAPAGVLAQDRLLDVNEAAKLLGMKPASLRRRHAEFPFTRRISKKTIKFSSAGIARWQRRLR
jgi:predicted DNA-binding transcriptional regulator AlpA